MWPCAIWSGAEPAFCLLCVGGSESLCLSGLDNCVSLPCAPVTALPVCENALLELGAQHTFAMSNICYTDF